MIELQNICKTYQLGEQTICALDGVTFQIQQGEYVAIMGHSGSGKSTLMHILGLLDSPTSGSLSFNGQNIEGLSQEQQALLRRDVIGFIFQKFHLLAKDSALENVMLPAFYRRFFHQKERALSLLSKVGLGGRAEQVPSKMSGGQQQRVAIARSLMNQPQVILADEPTGNLDEASEKQVLEILRQLHQDGMTIIVVTHDETVASHANRVIHMKDGRVFSDIIKEKSKSDFVNSEETKKTSSVALASSEFKNVHTASLLPFLIPSLTLGLQTLSRHKVRTILSLLGILMGVASILGILSLGQGAQSEIEKNLASLGGRVLSLRNGVRHKGAQVINAGSASVLTYADALDLQTQLPGIDRVSAIATASSIGKFDNANFPIDLVGVSPLYPEIRKWEIQIGRFFTPNEYENSETVAVLGGFLAKQLCGGASCLGQTIKIDHMAVKVVGVLKEKGRSTMFSQDENAWMPLESAQRRSFGRLTVDTIDIEVNKKYDLISVKKDILDWIKRRHEVALADQDDAFQVEDMTSVREAQTRNQKTLQLLLTTLASISLLVGGIGIMNIMIVSVTERTQEIGLRKALGATSREVLLQFLMESLALTGLGAVLGTALGLLAAIVGGYLLNWPSEIGPLSILISAGSAVLVGLVFGIYPARQAAQLHPIEALRHEG
jgi:macrolide transport system ATP-binding/permease protein